MKTFLLKNATILDAGHNNELLDVLVEDGVISAVAGGISSEAAECVLDLRGCTLLPGLFNNHVHFVDPSGSPEKTFKTDFLKEWALNGVTGVRDMGIDADVKSYDDYNAWKAAVSGPETPELYSYGYFQHLCPLQMPKDMPAPPPGAMPPGGAPPAPKPFHLLGSVENAKKAAEAAMDAGCQGIKIHGFRRDEELMKQIRALVGVAGMRGGFVSAHINTTDETLVLCECGCHEAGHIAHDLTAEKDVEFLARSNFMVCPTISAYTRMKRDGMLSPAMYDAVLKNTENYHKAGVRLTVGTDFMGIIDPPYESCFAPVFEMKMMASCGMSVQDVITAATLYPAILCGVSNGVGEIRPGRRADLIAARGGVDGDFEALNHIGFVMNKGTVIKNELSV